MSDEKMKKDEVIEQLNRAAAAQYRSLLLLLGASATLPPLQLRGSAEWAFASATEELEETRLLLEKIVALGGVPRTDVEAFSWPRDPADAGPAVIQAEEQAIEALAEAIPPTGTEPESEAVEHLVEHLIMKKQHRVDILRGAGGDTPTDARG